MNSELSIEKQEFTLVKEKIIKTNELLTLYNEKTVTLERATRAFKNLKVIYENLLPEVNKLNILNEHLNDRLERLRSQHEKTNRELNELKSEYMKVEALYQQHLIESQLITTELEQKLKQCTCEQNLPTTSSGRKTLEDQIRELKEKNQSLKKQNCSLNEKNKRLERNKSKDKYKEEIDRLTEKLENAELTLKNQSNLEDTIVSLKKCHEDEVNALKMEVSRVSLDENKMKDLEKEYFALSQEMDTIKNGIIKKCDFATQTEDFCEELPVQLHNTVCIEVREIEEQVEEVNADALTDMLKEMIWPLSILSPLSPVVESAEIPSPLLDVQESVDDDITRDESISQSPLPNIIVTPPTPSVDVNGSANVQFPMLTDPPVTIQPNEWAHHSSMHAENKAQCKIKLENIAKDTDLSMDIDCKETVPRKCEAEPIEAFVRVNCGNSDTRKNYENKIKENYAKESEELLNVDRTSTVVEAKVDSPIAPTVSENIALMADNASGVIRCVKQALLTKKDPQTMPTLAPNNFDKPLRKKQRRNRKVFIPYPYGINAFVKPKRNQSKLSNFAKRGKPRNDTILSALRTLQRNKINFTISNERIPLARSYGCCSIVSPSRSDLVDQPRTYRSTFSFKTTCWDKRCTQKNSLMMLRKVSHYEEPELLGFFSVKDEVVSPVASRGTVKKKPDFQDLIQQLLNGIKELTDAKRKAKKTSKTKVPEFNSETESELEGLFNNSEDILGRNKKLLAAARGRGFESSFESESDLMGDSGLVTAVEDETSTPAARQPDIDILHRLQVQSDTDCSLLNSSEKKRVFEFAQCPAMLSPITHFSPSYFKVPNIEARPRQLDSFCPIIVSPTASSGENRKEMGSSKTRELKSSVRQKITFDNLETPKENLIDLSIKTSDLNYSLNDISLSHFDVSSSTSADIDDSFRTSTECIANNTRASKRKGDDINQAADGLVPEKRKCVGILNVRRNSTSSVKTGTNNVIDAKQNLFSSDSEVADKESLGANNNTNEKETPTKSPANNTVLESTMNLTAANTLSSNRHMRLKESIKKKFETFKIKYMSKVNTKNFSACISTTVSEGTNSLQTTTPDIQETVRHPTETAATSSDQKDDKVLKASISQKDVSGYSQGTSGHQKEEKSKILKEDKDTVNSHSTSDKRKKITIVQDVIITQGQTINLMPARSTVRRPPKKRLARLSSPATTPVDILSLVMQEMTRNTQSVSKLCDSDKTSTAVCDVKERPTRIMTRARALKEAQINEEKKIIDDDPYPDCPQSPDVVNLPDRLPRLIPTEKPKVLPPSKVRFLIDRLMIYSSDESILDEIIGKFAFQDTKYMVRIILEKLSRDIYDKADTRYPLSPPMTITQRVLLGFLVKLDRSTHPGILDKFLETAELELYRRTTRELHIVQSITRLYTAACKITRDLDRIRRFIGDSFYFTGDFAVPILFTVLTMWPDVLPMESEISKYPLAKVIVQLCYMKPCNKPGYNLLPLRDLLHKYYGYPTERWSSEEVFEEILIEYIRNPSIKLSEYTLMLFLKNMPAKWVYGKVKGNLMPLYQFVPETNPNLKATLLITLANICRWFNVSNEVEQSYLSETYQWLQQLENVKTDPIVQRALCLARMRLPKIYPKKKKCSNLKPKKPLVKTENDISEHSRLCSIEDNKNSMECVKLDLETSVTDCMINVNDIKDKIKTENGLVDVRNVNISHESDSLNVRNDGDT